MRRILSESACHNELWTERQDFPSLVSMVSAILTFSNSAAVNRLSSTITGFPVSAFTAQPRYGPECGTRYAWRQKYPSLARSRPTMNNAGLPHSDDQRFRELAESRRRRSSLRAVCIPSRTIHPCLSRTSFTPWDLFSSPPFRRSSINNTRIPGRVKNASRAHFSTKCGGTIAKEVNGLPALRTCIAPSEISVLPVPHSAITMAVFACCQRLATPMMAMVCAGKGFRSNPEIRGETGSSNGWSAGYS